MVSVFGLAAISQGSPSAAILGAVVILALGVVKTIIENRRWKDAATIRLTTLESTIVEQRRILNEQGSIITSLRESLKDIGGKELKERELKHTAVNKLNHASLTIELYRAKHGREEDDTFDLANVLDFNSQHS